jgi:hypothetical protein
MGVKHARPAIPRAAAAFFILGESLEQRREGVATARLSNAA